jgi:hypothetical protein
MGQHRVAVRSPSYQTHLSSGHIIIAQRVDVHAIADAIGSRTREEENVKR